MAVILLSLAAALAFAVAAVLQQHAAAAQPSEQNMRLSLVISLAQRPLWLAGIGASAVGTLLQLLALWRGSLVTVQPLLVCGLLFALPINALWMHRRRPGWHELVAAAAVCGGLALFLVATDPRAGHGSAPLTAWIIAVSSLLTATAVLVGSSFAARGAARSCLLAGAAGLINGLSAAFTKGVAQDLARHWHEGLGPAVVHVLTGWQVYAFAATLLLVVLLVQSAFQSGPIRWSLPALTAFNPVTSVILGATVLDEQVRSSPLALTGAAVGLLLVVGGILALSSSSLITGGREIADAAALGTPDVREESPGRRSIVQVKVSTRGDYASRALLSLALRGDDAPTSVRDIAERTGLPQPYLEQILLALKGAGIVRSKRGVGGGYVLARSPEMITLGEIVSAVDGPIVAGDFGQPHENGACDHEGQCVLLSVWAEVGEHMRHHLDSFSLADIVARARGGLAVTVGPLE